MKYFIYAVIVIVAAAIVVGVIVAGSPADRRAARFDEERVSDLQGLQSQVLYYWQQKDLLPETIDQLNNEFSGYSTPRDPQNGNKYEYRTTGELSFELCASFNMETAASNVDGSSKYVQAPYSTSYYYNDNPSYWSHSAGKICFSRTIDPVRDKLPE